MFPLLATFNSPNLGFAYAHHFGDFGLWYAFFAKFDNLKYLLFCKFGTAYSLTASNVFGVF